jgi:hypothetical protein
VVVILQEVIPPIFLTKKKLDVLPDLVNTKSHLLATNRKDGLIPTDQEEGFIASLLIELLAILHMATLNLEVGVTLHLPIDLLHIQVRFILSEILVQLILHLIAILHLLQGQTQDIEDQSRHLQL